MLSDLSVSIVNFNSCELIKKALKSIFECKGDLDIDVYVVDNNSVDESVDMIRKDFPEVHLICSTKNTGFAAGNNKVLRTFNSRYCLITNPDIVVFPDTLPKMVHFMDNHSQAGAVGCKILNNDHTLQYSCRRYPKLSTIISRGLAVDILMPKNVITKRYLMQDWTHDKIVPVNWLTGCCIMLRKETIDDVGFFDERYFLYFEDADLCYRISKKWQIFYLPDVKMIHGYQHESRKLGSLRHKIHHITSAYIFFKTHGFQPDSAGEEGCVTCKGAAKT